MRPRFAVLVSFLLFAMGVAPAGSAQQHNRVALLIGNAVYPDADAPLKEPMTDARALGDELQHWGFDVTIGENLKERALKKRSTSSMQKSILSRQR